MSANKLGHKERWPHLLPPRSGFVDLLVDCSVVLGTASEKLFFSADSKSRRSLDHVV